MLKNPKSPISVFFFFVGLLLDETSHQLPLSLIFASYQQWYSYQWLTFSLVSLTQTLNPSQALVHFAEDIIHMLAEILPFDGQMREPWVLDLESLKEEFYFAVHFILESLRAVSKYHHNYNKARQKRFYCSSIVEETMLCTVTVFTVFLTDQQLVYSGPPGEYPPGTVAMC